MPLNHGSLIPLTSQYFRPVLSWPFQCCHHFSHFQIPAIWDALAFEKVYLELPTLKNQPCGRTSLQCSSVGARLEEYSSILSRWFSALTFCWQARSPSVTIRCSPSSSHLSPSFYPLRTYWLAGFRLPASLFQHDH